MEGRKKREVRAVFEVMADLGVVHEEASSKLDEVDDDMTEFGHVSTTIKLGSQGELPHGSPKRIDSVAKSTTEDPIGGQEMRYFPGSKKPGRKQC